MLWIIRIALIRPGMESSMPTWRNQRCSVYEQQAGKKEERRTATRHSEYMNMTDTNWVTVVKWVTEPLQGVQVLDIVLGFIGCICDATIFLIPHLNKEKTHLHCLCTHARLKSGYIPDNVTLNWPWESWTWQPEGHPGLPWPLTPWSDPGGSWSGTCASSSGQAPHGDQCHLPPDESAHSRPVPVMAVHNRVVGGNSSRMTYIKLLG